MYFWNLTKKQTGTKHTLQDFKRSVLRHGIQYGSDQDYYSGDDKIEQAGTGEACSRERESGINN